MSRNLERLELWSDVEPAGGVRLALVGLWRSAAERITLEGESTFNLTLDRDNPALVTPPLDVIPPGGQIDPEQLNCAPRRVLRAVYSDGTVEERRIMDADEADDLGEVTEVITADSILTDLSVGGICYRSHPDGTRSYYFQASTLTIGQHLANYILPALSEAGQGYWKAGQIDYEAPVTVVYDADSPLAACRKLASAAVGSLELQIRLDRPAGVYRIDFLQQTGKAAPAVRLRPGGGLQRLGISRSLRDVVTRVYGFGATDPEIGRATLGQNAWIVSALRTEGIYRWLTLEDPAGGPGPIGWDGQYQGSTLNHLLANPTVPIANFTVLDSRASSQEVQVTVPAGQNPPAASARILYRLSGPGGASLAYLQIPTDTGKPALGIRVGHVERPEATAVLNIAGNPMLRDPVSAGQSGEIVHNWFRGLSNTTAVLETNPLYWRTGGRSLRARFFGGNAFILNFAVAGFSRRCSFFVDVMTLSGAVDVKLQVSLVNFITLSDGTFTNVVSYPGDIPRLYPGTPAPTFGFRTSALGVWERLGMEGVHDGLAMPVRSASLWIRPVQNPFQQSECIIDATQITGTNTYRDLVEGSGSNLLVQDANAKLALYNDLGVSITTEALDVASADDPSFPLANYVLGGSLVLWDPRLGVQIGTRVLGWDRDWITRENLRLMIASQGSDLSRVLASRIPSPPPPVG